MDTPKPNRRAGIVLQQVGSQAILYDQPNGRAHVINRSAAQIWELCNGQSTADDICVALATFYHMPAADVQADVHTILATFRELCVLD